MSAGLVLSGGCEGDPVAPFPLESGGLLAVSGIPSSQMPPPEFGLLHMAFSPCTCLSVQISPFCKDAVILDEDPAAMNACVLLELVQKSLSVKTKQNKAPSWTGRSGEDWAT